MIFTKRIENFYGPPLSGKTTAILELIKQLHREQPGKIARAYVGDGSLSNYLDSGLIEAGLVKVFDYSGRPMPMTVTELMTEAWWAEDEFDPNSRMVQLTPDEVDETRLWIYEGGSVMGAYILGNVEGGLAYRSARNEKIGQDSPITIKDANGRVYGGNPQSHYNVAQRHMVGCYTRSKRLPGMIIWTHHERGAEDKLQGETVVGPEIAGSALTATIAREFNNTLHFTTATKQSKIKDTQTDKLITQEETEYRIYTRDHYDPDGKFSTKYRAGIRTPRPDMIKQYYSSQEPGTAILEFYRDLAKAKLAYGDVK